ncbi:NIPSNAP-domain-containing protein [Sistotremastrum suecicum HHB10207 ss-3]|uniref:NIPSNAP-domain-containing protein n=1 Tax=Sistotremastrum suecicum HHB10207 ss-3 TaxID=1314776 RepID=A0A166IMN8_9AGAM|nr:NIPSNAP-domain-containing protein [Sistotremastrum suecicum HHB10207 ss-3]
MFHRLTTQIARPLAYNPVRHLSVVQSILHGSPEAKRAGEVEIQQHSKVVARGKYVHAFEVHRVKPDSVEEYKKAAEKYYTGLVADKDLNVKLTGGWETLVGEQDTFVHILEYENYGGYDRTTELLRGSEHEQSRKAIAPFLNSKSLQLNQEFAFFPSSPPRSKGGIFELRTYQLQPGTLLEWETTWRRGIEARRKFVEPVGAWFSHIGRLHQVHHLWQYPNLQVRKETRQKAWQVDGWSDTVHKTSQLATYMDAFILIPLPYSPLK